MKRVVVLACLLSASAAHADDEPKSPTVALALSAGAGVVLPVALFASAVAANTPLAPTRPSALFLGGALVAAGVGPSLGHWYVGEYLTTGLWIRLAGGAVVALVASSNSCGGLGCEGSATTLLALGAVTVGVGMIVDVATARGAARSFNHHGAVTITPTVMTARSGPVMGLGLGGSF
jgi:hypothetical protein